MKTWFQNLSIYFKTFFVSSVVLVIAFCAVIFGYFVNLYGIPNGVLAGGALGLLSYFLLGISDKKDLEKKKPTLAIVISISRFFLIAALLAVAALLDYQYDIKVLNVFAVLGGYLISPVTFVIIALMDRKNV